MAKRIDQLNSAQALDANNDVLPIYQPTASSPRTRKVTVGDIAGLNTAAITAAANAASAAQTTANAAIPLTQKGVANGVATLGADGKVPASQLNITGTSFKGNWDATANSPTLADGTGTGGDWYFVQNGTSRNLGSGSVAWTTGALIIHNGTIWVENEATNVVLSVAGRTGAIVLTTADVSASTNRNYVTDNQQAALAGNFGTPSVTNKYVTEDGLDDALAGLSGGGTVIVTGGGTLRIADFEDGSNTSGTGTARSLASLGYSNATAAARWPLTASLWGGITASSTDYDTVCVQEAFETLRQGTNRIRKLAGGQGAYVLSNQIYLPSYKSGISSNADSQMWVFDGEGCLFRVTGTQAYAFTSNISTQTEAKDSAVDNRWRFGNFKIKGTGANTAIRMGATRSALIEQVEIDGFETGWLSGFMLNAQYNNIATVNCTTGMKIDRGWWPSAGYATAGNQPRFYNCRFRMVDTDQIGCHVIGTDGPAFRDCTIEGTNANYGIYIDNADSSVCKYATVDNTHIEMETGGDFVGGAIYYGGQSAFGIRVSAAYNQFEGTPEITLLHLHSKVGVNKAWVSYCDNSENNDAWKFRNTADAGGNGSWDFNNVRLKGNPTTAARVANVANPDGIWMLDTPDAVIPTEGRIRLTPLLI